MPDQPYAPDVVYKDIEAKLLSLNAGLIAAGAMKIAHIEFYEGQYLLEPGQQPFFDRPAIFVEIVDVAWEDETNGEQSGVARIRLHCVRDKFTRGSDTSRDDDEHMKMVSWPQLIQREMHKFPGMNFTGLLRRGDFTIDNIPFVFAHVIEYVTLIQDKGASRMDDFTDSAGDHDVAIDKETPIPPGAKPGSKYPNVPVS